MTDPLDRLAIWLRPFSITPNADALEERRRLVTDLAADDELEPLTLASATYGQDPGGTVAEAIRRIDGSIVVEGSEQLVAAFAAAAVAVRLADADCADVILLGLLVQSANFLGLEPPVAELPEVAARSLFRSARRERQRPEPGDLAREIRALLTPPRSNGAAPESAEAVQESPAALVKLARERDQALRAVARRVDALVGWTGSRLALVEEELDLLWWSRRGRSLNDEPWDSLTPPRRAAISATELAALLAQLPAPPSARSLLREALGMDAEVETPIIDVARAMVPSDQLRRHPLLPLTTFLAIAADLGESEADAIARVFERTVPLSIATTRPLIDIAEQVLRERQIMALL